MLQISTRVFESSWGSLGWLVDDIRGLAKIDAINGGGCKLLRCRMVGSEKREEGALRDPLLWLVRTGDRRWLSVAIGEASSGAGGIAQR